MVCAWETIMLPAKRKVTKNFFMTDYFKGQK
jgi:hypothetical protein